MCARAIITLRLRRSRVYLGQVQGWIVSMVELMSSSRSHLVAVIFELSNLEFSIASLTELALNAHHDDATQPFIASVKFEIYIDKAACVDVDFQTDILALISKFSLTM